MRAIDQLAMSEFGIPGIVLMENAGLQVVEAVRTALQGLNKGAVVVVCGTGNNGGDGMVVARHLLQAGLHVESFLVGEESGLTADALTNYTILRALGAVPRPVRREEDLEGLAHALVRSDLVVDALFGTGFHGQLPPLAAGVVRVLNASGRPVVSVDIPSGVDADSGRVAGEAVQATWTVTLGLPKRGLFAEPGRSHAGILTVADIGLPRRLTEDPELRDHVVTEDMVAPLFRPRPAATHKGDFGHVLVVGGSVGMTGAVIMASHAALCSGAGLVTAAVPASQQPLVEGRLVEVMTLPLAENGHGSVGLEALPALENMLGAVSVCAVGPGMGRFDEAHAVVRFILERAGVPVIVDADGLNAVAEDVEVLKNRQVPIVLTPHPGEMARLSGLSVAEIQADRLEVARRYAVEWGVTLVLKGHHTVVATPRGETFLNLTGNPGMATAGSGDVLCGIIAGGVAQGLRPAVAAMAGVYVHGRAGDLAREQRGERGLLAMDIADRVPEVLRQFETA